MSAPVRITSTGDIRPRELSHRAALPINHKTRKETGA